MAKKVTDAQTIDTIISSIHDGLSETEIFQLKIGRKPIRRIANEFNLVDKLKYNNIKYKSNQLSEYALAKRNIKLIELDKIYGMLVLESINNGGILQDVKNIMKNISHKQVLYFLKYKNLDIQRKENSKNYINIQSKINGRKAIPITRGVELKPITSKIIKRFEELKHKLKYKQQVYNTLKNEFGFGSVKCKQLCEKYGYPKNNPQTGRLNPMYGKSPGKNAGIGVKCWILNDGIKYFCRSSLELRIMCHLIFNNITFQISKHRIKYKDDMGIGRTYCPDIVIGNSIYEIKPYNMLPIRLNVLKSEALKEYCSRFNLKYGGYLTENDIDISKYDINFISTLINSGKIIIDNKNLEKLKRNII